MINLQDWLLFREHLRAYPDEARCYAQLKRELAARFPTDQAAYALAKRRYIRSVVDRARAKRAIHPANT